MTLYNATPHDVVVHSQCDGALVTTVYPKQPCVLRLRSEPQIELESLLVADDMPALVRVMTPPVFSGLVAGLPASLCRGLYVGVLVSAMVADYLQAHCPVPSDGALAARSLLRVYVPDTGPDSVVRDPTTGQIVAVTRLLRYSALL